MKRGTPAHPKVKRLMRALGCQKLMAVGILESLWHWTARYAVRGDIGKHSDQDIADGIEYPDDAAELITALVEAGWLDRSESHRLVVHDWHDHCDEAAMKAVKRNRLRFASLPVETVSGDVETPSRQVENMSRHVSTPSRQVGKDPDTVSTRPESVRTSHSRSRSQSQSLFPGGKPPGPSRRSSRTSQPSSPSWLDTVASIWAEQMGGEFPGGQAARYFRRIFDPDRGWPDGFPEAFSAYLREHRGSRSAYLSIPKFASAWQQWRPVAGNDEGFVC